MTDSPTASAVLATTVTDLPSIVGRSFGPSGWREVTQAEVTAFADLTGDHNPIHVDPEAAAATPYGTTIAHGLFTLSLVVPMMAEIFRVTGQSMGVNYGLNRLRFPAPVPTGSRIRVRGEVASVDEVAGGYQLVASLVWEIEGGTKPVCAAELVLRYFL